MRYSISCICFLLLGLISKAKQKTQFLDSFYQVKSINPADTDYTDLQIIGSAIGDATVVFLGEQDHGNAATFTAKTRLIKYLHEKLGFNVLVFESDFYGLTSANERFEKRELNIDDVRYNIYSIWSQCSQAQEIFSYINQCYPKNQLHIAGIDCRRSRYSINNFVNEFKAATSKLDYCLKDTVAYNRFIAVLDELYKTEYKSTATDSDKKNFFRYLEGIKLSFKKGSFYSQALHNLEAFANNSWKVSQSTALQTIRDIAMAENLLWLKNVKYNDEKIIVWAHSGHCMKQPNTIKDKYKLGHNVETSAGEHFSKLYKGKTYVLGFTSLYGTSKIANVDTVKRFDIRKEDSFENWIDIKGFDYGFINFSTLNYSGNFDMAVLDNRLHTSNWTKNFDGIFYIKEMYGCDKVK